MPWRDSSWQVTRPSYTAGLGHTGQAEVRLGKGKATRWTLSEVMEATNVDMGSSPLASDTIKASPKSQKSWLPTDAA